MKRTGRPKPKGQATVELIVTLFAFFAIFFMFVQLALGFAVANFYQYATFMAARAYLAGWLSPGDQKAAATRYLSAMVAPDGRERFGSIAKGVGGGDGELQGATIGASSRVHKADAQARSTGWEEGVTYAFRIKMHMAPLLPGIDTGPNSTVLLESQSWLGREPTEKDCEDTLFQRRKTSGVGNVVLYDNGC